MNVNHVLPTGFLDEFTQVFAKVTLLKTLFERGFPWEPTPHGA